MGPVGPMGLQGKRGKRVSASSMLDVNVNKYDLMMPYILLY